MLESAIANAKDRFEDVDVDRLFVSEAYVNEGPRMKRIRPAPHGPRVPLSAPHVAHRDQGGGESGAGGQQVEEDIEWDRRYILTVSGWASTSPGVPAGSPSRATRKLLQEDLELSETLRERLKSAGVSSIEVDRPGNKLRVTIRTSRPGIIIGRKGAEIEKLKQDLAKRTKREVFIDIQEVHKPELDAQLVSESIALQLEKRVAFRRAMRKAVDSALRFGCKGIKVRVSGRLNGAEIARSEWYLQGQLPLHTLRADIDYGFSEAHTTYGVIGVKAWLYKGEILDGGSRLKSLSSEPEPRRDRGDRRDRAIVATGRSRDPPRGRHQQPAAPEPGRARRRRRDAHPARSGGPILPPLMAPQPAMEAGSAPEAEPRSSPKPKPQPSPGAPETPEGEK